MSKVLIRCVCVCVWWGGRFKILCKVHNTFQMKSRTPDKGPPIKTKSHRTLNDLSFVLRFYSIFAIHCSQGDLTF